MQPQGSSQMKPGKLGPTPEQAPVLQALSEASPRYHEPGVLGAKRKDGERTTCVSTTESVPLQSSGNVLPGARGSLQAAPRAVSAGTIYKSPPNKRHIKHSLTLQLCVHPPRGTGFSFTLKLPSKFWGYVCAELSRFRKCCGRCPRSGSCRLATCSPSMLRAAGQLCSPAPAHRRCCGY